jgi:uncharacterized protein YeeX (DUF496 family)
MEFETIYFVNSGLTYEELKNVISHLQKEYVKEMDILSQRNYHLRMEIRELVRENEQLENYVAKLESKCLIKGE